MANFTMNVNSNAAIILTAKLERLNKSAFPSAVRSTLNDAAFSMKQKEILDSAKRNMTVRNPTVFKKFTGVKRANGFNVSSMHSEVGFIPKDGVSGSKVPEGMEHNEVGGTDKEGAMYLAKTRTGNSLAKRVRRKARFDKNKIARGTSSYRKSRKLANVPNMMASYKEKMPTYIETSKGKFLVQVKKFDRNGKKLSIDLDFLMRSRKKNPARAKASHFNREAALKTQKQMDDFYLKAATFQFNKVLKSTR